MNAFLQSKSPRERAALAVGLFVTVVCAVFMLFTEPGDARLKRTRAQLRGAVAAHEHVVDIARQVAVAAPAVAAGSGAPPARETLMSVIDASAEAAGITGAVKRFAPASDHEVSVVLEAVGFDALMSWLAELHAEHALDIEQFTANPATIPGSVNVSLVLSR